MFPLPFARRNAGSASRTLRACHARAACRNSCAAFLAAAFGVALVTGCDEDTVVAEFRGAAADGLETGVRAILGGLIDGTFAALEVGASDGGGSGPSGAVGTSTDTTTTTDTTESTSAQNQR